MSNFDWALTVVLHHEGGFVDHPDDPGGATDFGVSLRFLRNVGEDIDGDGDIDVDDIRALEPSDVRRLYGTYFWRPARCQDIRSLLLSVKIFDMAVNMGQKQAYRLVQHAINSLQYTPQLVVDGVVGPATLRALNSLERRDYALLAQIRAEQAAFYERLIERKPQLASFRTGWRRRAAS